MENVLIGCGLSHFHKICHEPIVHIMMGLGVASGFDSDSASNIRIKPLS